MHDKAFELGLFTLNESFHIYINPNASSVYAKLVDELANSQGKAIKLSATLPLKEALAEHWRRTKITSLLEQ
jgi:hypothetical protein